jgi:hypothetical protein
VGLGTPKKEKLYFFPDNCILFFWKKKVLKKKTENLTDFANFFKTSPNVCLIPQN